MVSQIEIMSSPGLNYTVSGDFLLNSFFFVSLILDLGFFEEIHPLICEGTCRNPNVNLHVLLDSYRVVK